MEQAFNPYQEWLGLPGGAPPRSHYELLGLRPFETDREAIAQAADGLKNRLRRIRPGPYMSEWQALLDEIAAARQCLLDPFARTAYDARLRNPTASGAPSARLATPPTVATPPTWATPPNLATPPTMGASPTMATPPTITTPPTMAAPPTMATPPPTMAAPPGVGAAPASSASPPTWVAGQIYTPGSQGYPVGYPATGPYVPAPPTWPAEAQAQAQTGGGYPDSAIPPVPSLGQSGDASDASFGSDVLNVAAQFEAVARRKRSAFRIGTVLWIACLGLVLGGGAVLYSRLMRASQEASLAPGDVAAGPGGAPVVAGPGPALVEEEHAPAVHPMAREPAVNSAPTPAAVAPEPELVAQPAMAEMPSAPGARPAPPAQASAPSPAPPPAAPEMTIDPAKQAALRSNLEAMRVAMARRDLEEAKRKFDEAKANAQTEEENRSVARHRNLLEYLNEFWRLIRMRLAAFRPGDEVELGQTRIIVVEAAPDMISFRTGGRVARYQLDTMPAAFVTALADEVLAKDAQSKVIFGAFLATSGNVERAQQLWREAAQAGEKIDDFVPPLAELAEAAAASGAGEGGQSLAAERFRKAWQGLSQRAAGGRGAAHYRELAKLAITAAQDATDAGCTNEALALCRLTVELGRKAQSPALVRQALDSQRKLEALQKRGAP